MREGGGRRVAGGNAIALAILGAVALGLVGCGDGFVGKGEIHVAGNEIRIWPWSEADATHGSLVAIGGGTSAGALDHGVTSEEGGAGVWVRNGMGFFHGGFTGQHHVARGRFGRLMVAVAESERFGRGFGIDEDTAVVVDRGIVTVAGRSRVAIVERAGYADGWTAGPFRLTWTQEAEQP